ncbi:lysozyme family protein [Sphingomonas jejuensis]|uniref:Lysozyme family protein n=1 Tax=Sphingomonas jejuensis TaxID=904715 RepID=A0ABX0XI57_9SPHN|nr:glycosyl hydrolase 108 family protein [Sphingomonas jejuensis]NJC32529.1 lysozyme family protein [Sphingomonas jejuensis]
MADVAELIEALIEREGGFVDHPADRGGATMWGITERVARAHGWQGAMARMPQARAAAIYRRIYWERPRLDAVATRAPAIASEMFGTGVNMGTGIAVRFLQRALNALNRQQRDFADIAVDGAIGPATLGALDGFLRVRGRAGEAVLLKAIDALQGARYVRLAEQRPANEAFLYGWLANRIG